MNELGGDYRPCLLKLFGTTTGNTGESLGVVWEIPNDTLAEKKSCINADLFNGPLAGIHIKICRI